MKSRRDEIRLRRVKSCLRKIMDSIIKRLQDKNNRKNFTLLQSCFKTAFFKKSQKTVCRKNRKRNILIILTRIHTRERVHARMRARFYI